MNKPATLRRETVTPMTLYSFDTDSQPAGGESCDALRGHGYLQFRNRSTAFATLARLAVTDNRLTEAVELYRLAIEEGEEFWGPDSQEVKILLKEIARVFASLGQFTLCVFYRRRANEQ